MGAACIFLVISKKCAVPAHFRSSEQYLITSVPMKHMGTDRKAKQTYGEQKRENVKHMGSIFLQHVVVCITCIKACWRCMNNTLQQFLNMKNQFCSISEIWQGSWIVFYKAGSAAGHLAYPSASRRRRRTKKMGQKVQQIIIPIIPFLYCIKKEKYSRYIIDFFS